MYNNNNINNNQQDNNKNYLRAKIQIGNSRGAITFESNQAVFHHDDIDPIKRKRKEEVKNWSKPSILQSNNTWNQTTITDEKFLERRTTENFIKDRSRPYQYNYRAETLGPKLQPQEEKPSKFKVTLKNTGNQVLNTSSTSTNSNNNNKPDLFPPTIQTLKRTQEMPTHPKFESDFSTEWNLSNAVTKKELQQSLQKLDQTSHNNTNKKSKKFAKTTSNYVSPMQRSIALQEEVRKQKRSGTFTLEKHIFQEPEEPVDRNTLVNRFAIEPSLKFKTTKHTGTWDFNKIEGRHMWSDTGSYEYETRGDTIKIHNPDAYNYSNPTLSKTR